MTVARWLALLATALLGCQRQTEALDPDLRPLHLSSAQNQLELRLARAETNCDGCVLVEFREDGVRSAFFLNPDPDCVLTQSGVYRLGGDRKNRELILALEPRGVKQLQPCRSLVPKEEIFGRFLVTHGSSIAGWSHLYDEPERSLSIEGVERYDALSNALDPETEEMPWTERLNRTIQVFIGRSPAA